MRRVSWLVLLVALGGCGAPEESTGEPTGEAAASRPPTEPEPTAESTKRAARKPPTRDRGTVVRLGGSPFGQMLFDRRGQAMYLFEPEAAGRPDCYGACETAWPPVLTRGRPVAADGLRPGLLGTVERRDGSTQVTYGGWPLYFYAHEAPGEVLCHDVVLNGGLWLAVGPDGQALPT